MKTPPKLRDPAAWAIGQGFDPKKVAEMRRRLAARRPDPMRQVVTDLIVAMRNVQLRLQRRGLVCSDEAAGSLLLYELTGSTNGNP